MNNQNKKIYHYLIGLILYSSLIIGFIFGENSTGGAYNDYIAHREIIYKFSKNFNDTLINFDKESTRHSPFLLIIFSFFYKINLPDTVFRIINLHFLLLTILFFFKCLKVKFPNYNNTVLYFIAILLFLSPTFRSLSIWPDSRLYGLFFFTVSVYFYLNFKHQSNEKDKLKFALLNTFYLCIASYFSPNFCLFVFFFYFFSLRI